MIQSMTAFARVQGQGDWGSAVWEIRSINHRYLELVVRLPDNLHELEGPMRECIRDHVKRGKIECHLRYQPGDISGSDLTINAHLAAKLCQASETIRQMLQDTTPINPMDILQWPGILQIPEVDLEIIEDKIIFLLEKGLKELIEARLREGAELKQLFFQRLDKMKIEIHKVREYMPHILASQRERLFTKFSE